MAIDISSLGLGGGAQAKAEKFADIIQGGGTLSASQEAKLANISEKAGQDLASAFGYTPTSSRYDYVSAAAPTGIATLDTGATSAAGPVSWAPTSGDQYQYLSGGQENKLNKLAGLYAAGELEGREGKIAKLESLLGKGQLGTLESYFSPVTYTDPTDLGFSLPTGITAQDIASYVTQYGSTDPTRVYQYATQYGLNPENLAAVLGGYDTTPRYGGPTIYNPTQLQDIFTRGQQGYTDAFGNIISSTFGNAQDQAALEARLGLQAGALSSSFDPTKFASSSIEDIESALSTSGFNKAQESFKLAEAIGSVYGFTPQQIDQFAKNIFTGNVKNESLMQTFEDALSGNKSVNDLQFNYFSTLAQNDPENQLFKTNPNLLTVFTPIDEPVAAERDSGQYGTINKLPVLSASEADRLLAGNTFLRGGNTFGYGTSADNSLGWDLHSKYLGYMANGAGIYGVQSNPQQIDYFDQIEQRIQDLGGLQIKDFGEGNVQQGVYVDMPNADGQIVSTFVPVEQLFATYSDPETGQSDGAANYQQYQSTLNSLNSGAKQLGIETTGSISDLYNAVDTAAQNIYVVSGRADSFDPELMEDLGLLNKKGEVDKNAHVRIMYQKVGDKLVPLELLDSQKFQDPNTSSGFFGDIASFAGEILSMPPVQMALMMSGGFGDLIGEAAGFGASGPGAAGAFDMAGAANLGPGFAASNMAATIGTNIGSLVGLGGPSSVLLGNVLMNAGLAGLQTGITTGNLDYALDAALAGGMGTGIAGLTNVALQNMGGVELGPKTRNTISNIVGGAAAVSSAGQDVETYLKNRVLGGGIAWLAENGIDAASDKTGMTGKEKEVFRALIPVMLGEKLDAKDVLNIAKALDKVGVFDRTA